MQVPIAAHMHPDPMFIRFARHAPAHARSARERRAVWKRSEVMRVTGRARILDTKKARACAPPGESLFSSLFNVAARGGKSPRLQLSSSVYAARRMTSSPAAFRPCDLDASRQGRSRVPSHPIPECRPASSAPRVCLAAGLGGAYISRIVVVTPSPTRRPIPTIRRHGDLTVTTWSGLAAFHRRNSLTWLRADRVAELRSAPVMAPDFNQEAHI